MSNGAVCAVIGVVMFWFGMWAERQKPYIVRWLYKRGVGV